MNFIQMKKLDYLKDTIKKRRLQETGWEKIFANISKKQLLSEGIRNQTLKRSKRFEQTLHKWAKGA